MGQNHRPPFSNSWLLLLLANYLKRQRPGTLS